MINREVVSLRKCASKLKQIAASKTEVEWSKVYSKRNKEQMSSAEGVNES